MKILPTTSSTCAKKSRRAAFTLAEMMVALTVFAILTTGIVVANVYGLKMYQITSTKMNATRGIRTALGKMTDEIRACKTTWVGDMTTNGTFVAKMDGEAQTGSGILVHPTTNSSVYTIYFLNTSDLSFRRTTSAGVTTVLARQVASNYNTLFTIQNSSGTTLTNNSNNRVIHFGIKLYQPKKFGTIADYYVLQTSVTRRALD